MNIFLDSYLDNNIGDDLMIIGIAKSLPAYDFYLVTDNSTVSFHLNKYSNIKVYPTNQRKHVLKNIDVYIKLGGSIFQFMNLKQTMRRYLKYLELKKIKINGVKFGIIGCNVGPFYSKLSKIVASKEMKMCDFISVRDQESYNFVKKRS